MTNQGNVDVAWTGHEKMTEKQVYHVENARDPSAMNTQFRCVILFNSLLSYINCYGELVCGVTSDPRGN